MIVRAFAAQQVVSAIAAGRLVAHDKTGGVCDVPLLPGAPLWFHGTARGTSKHQRKDPTACAGGLCQSGCVYGPVVNSVKFTLVLSTMQVSYLAVLAGIWRNLYLSWTNQQENKVAENKTSMEEGSTESLAP